MLFYSCVWELLLRNFLEPLLMDEEMVTAWFPGSASCDLGIFVSA